MIENVGIHGIYRHSSMLSQPSISEARLSTRQLCPHVKPRLNVGLIMIAVSPRQPPQPYLRHGCGPNLHLGDNPIGIPTPTRSHQGATLRPRLPVALRRDPTTTPAGRTEARPYDRMVFSVMYHVENKQSRVAACCDLPGDGFSFCKVSDLARTMSKIYAI